MAIPLLGSNNRIDAATWNVLFADLDSKISRVMDNKNMFMLSPRSAILPLAGMIFYFVSGTRVYTAGASARSYNHQPFRDAARDLAFSVFNADHKVAVNNDPVPNSYRDEVDMGTSTRFWDRSLEAHTTQINDEPHWIIERAAGEITYRPQKIQKYALADIVIEGPGFETFLMDPAWNKYNFFRFHNCNNYTVTVDFNGVFSLVIPRWESKCVRRTSVTSGYLEGYRYFHKFKAGDPRVFEMPQSNTTPHGSMGANNVISPRVAYHWLGLFTDSDVSASGGPRLWIDPHHLNNLAALYAAHFPTVTDETLIGDLLHHKGKLIDVKTDGAGAVTKTELEFRGYADMKTRWPMEYQINVTDNGDGTLSLQTSDSANTHDLWSLSTNLLSQAGAIKPAVAGNAPYVLDSHKPASFPTPFEVTLNGSFNYRWFSIAEDSSIVSEQSESFAISARTVSFVSIGHPAIALHSDKVFDMFAVAKRGLAGPPHGALTNAQMTLTPFGLVLTYSYEQPLLTPVLQLGQFGQSFIPFDQDDMTLDGTTLTYQRAVTFDGYGWPTLVSPAFIGPRKGRVVAKFQEKEISGVFGAGTLFPNALGSPVRHHPNISGQPFTSDGADFGITPLKKTFKASETTGIKILAQLPALAFPTDFGGAFENPFDFAVYHNQDVIEEFLSTPLTGYSANRPRWLNNELKNSRMIRMNLLREHYNALASRINAVKKCYPFNLEHARFAGDQSALLPNSAGPFGGKFRPANQYASFALGSAEYKLAQQLGIPIKTKDDLPASYQTIKGTAQQLLAVTTRFREVFRRTGTVVTPDQFGPGSPGYTHSYERTQTLLESTAHFSAFSVAESGTLLRRQVFDGTTDDDSFYWVTVEDVKSKAEELGFLFRLERFVAPYALKEFRHSTAIRRDFVTKTEIIEQLGPEGPFPTFDPTPDYDKIFRQTPFGADAPGIPGNFALMTDALTLAECEWVRDVTKLRLLDYEAGDTAVARITGIHGFSANQFDISSMDTDFIVFLEFDLEARRYLRQNVNLSRYALDPDEIANVNNLIVPYRLTASALLQAFVSAGLERNSRAVLTNGSFVRHSTSDFSTASRRNAVGRLSHGATVIPLVSELATPGASGITLDQSSNLILSSSVAQDLLVLEGWPVTGL